MLKRIGNGLALGVGIALGGILVQGLVSGAYLLVLLALGRLNG